MVYNQKKKEVTKWANGERYQVAFKTQRETENVFAKNKRLWKDKQVNDQIHKMNPSIINEWSEVQRYGISISGSICVTCHASHGKYICVTRLVRWCHNSGKEIECVVTTICVVVCKSQLLYKFRRKIQHYHFEPL